MALPSTYQWSVAASLWSSDQFVPQSNFSKNQLQVVGDEETENQHGLLDIAGNVREWASNSSGDGGKAVLGGCYLDEDYSFNLFYSQPALDRRKGNGVRLVKNLLEGERFASSRAAIDFGEERDIMSLPPVSDEVFAVYRAPFEDYHKTLNPVVSGVDLPMLGTTVVDRVDLEDVTADADRTLPVYVFRDSKHQGQYKPIIYFPGAGSINTTSTDALVKSGEFKFRHLLAEGYAVFQFPVYSSTYEKRDEIKSHYPNESQSYADHVPWGQKKPLNGTPRRHEKHAARHDDVNARARPSKKNAQASRVTCPLLMLNKRPGPRETSTECTMILPATTTRSRVDGDKYRVDSLDTTAALHQPNGSRSAEVQRVCACDWTFDDVLHEVELQYRVDQPIVCWSSTSARTSTTVNALDRKALEYYDHFSFKRRP